ncbi:hypothetical protein ATL10_10543 [Bacillus sp. 196mf]|nr:hypothetical protein ATL10_10543 [Bacillus sp. 196mf]
MTKYGEMITGSYSAQELIDKNVVYAAGIMPQLIVNSKKMITSGEGRSSLLLHIYGEKSEILRLLYHMRTVLC